MLVAVGIRYYIKIKTNDKIQSFKFFKLQNE